MTDVVVGALALAGSVVTVLAGVGVLRFADVYQRMHAATKATTAGLALVALAAGTARPASAPKLALIFVAVLVTAPVAAHLIARAEVSADREADR